VKETATLPPSATGPSFSSVPAGATFATETWNVFESDAPFLSVTFTVTSYVPLSSYVWEVAVIAPAALSSKEACAELSPQSTSTFHGASAPGSENEPRVNTVAWPSSAFWFAGAVTVGVTFSIATTCTASESVSLAPSESATLTETLVLAGPSGKRQRKLPPDVVVSSEPSTRLPLSPQLFEATVNSSSPGSETVKL
jgi:hypothetical protein